MFTLFQIATFDSWGALSRRFFNDYEGYAGKTLFSFVLMVFVMFMGIYGDGKHVLSWGGATR